MHDMPMPKGVPWLDYPLALHSSRAYECDLNSTKLCAYKERYWVFWYEADHRYALPTIALFLSTIMLFGIGHYFLRLTPRRILQSTPVRKTTALARYLSYRSFRIPFLNWNSAPIGVLALGAVGTIYFFCMVLVPKPYYWPGIAHFGGSPPLATRSGWLALGCLPFAFATAGKSNLITLVTGVSHEKLQVFHRWIAYAFFICSLLHTFPFIVNDRAQGLLHESWNGSLFYWTGTVALLAQGHLTFASMSPLRNMAYEWFKFSHFLAALVFVLFLFFHCDYILTSWDYFIATGCLFAVSWLHRQARIYLLHGVNHRAEISLAENGWICVRVPTKIKWQAGQHFFVRFMAWSVHAGSIHPFTACSLPAPNTSSSVESGADAGASQRKEQDPKQQQQQHQRDGTSDLVFYIQPHGGFTAWLARRAAAAAAKPASIRVLLDGPFGGIDAHKLSQCEHQLVIAGGSGAGWMLPLLTTFLRKEKDRRDLKQQARDSNDGGIEAGAPQEADQARLHLVIATREIETRRWFEDSVREMMVQAGIREMPAGLEVETYYTGCEGGTGQRFGAGSGPGSGSGSASGLDVDEKTMVHQQQLQHQQVQQQKGKADETVTEGPHTSDSSMTEREGKFQIRHFDGRPDLKAIIEAEAAATATGAGVQLGVFVCGPLSMQSDVGNTVAALQTGVLKRGAGDVYLHMEHFAWA